MDALKDTLSKEIEQTNSDLEQTFNTKLEIENKFSKEIAGWIKNKLGPNLELVNQQFDAKLVAERKRTEEEAKKREEALWLIFGKKELYL